jgi:16S rRNA (guanine966-N2)-methyltransferase
MRRGKQNQLRIIGGQWRSRKLSFDPIEGLRPTTDRVRETLFNWLAPILPGARCADLFAGSGALGLEALSRGAAHCDFVDSSGRAIRQISKHLHTLESLDHGECFSLGATEFLARASERYDVVFIDPPFNAGLAGPTCSLLQERGLLTPGALVYVEMGLKETLFHLPPGWHLSREKTAGGVTYRLFETAR